MKSESKLIARLCAEKIPRLSGGHSYKSIFDQFAADVGPQLSETNQLFNEYTPHDDTHMCSLLQITDDLLGQSIESLNNCEACIIACAIYGHDWGMAVSEAEKHLIVTGAPQLHSQAHDFALLADEATCWSEFCKGSAISTDKNGHVGSMDEITKPQWLQYVRQTHARRAMARWRHYFKDDLKSLGSVSGEVCAGHWYDI
ncbi:MAG: hypothetical protein MJK04_19230, partial [Psychrosphaera sp.]|nr:hypothetical protein [Psychrosphaera sp.]